MGRADIGRTAYAGEFAVFVETVDFLDTWVDDDDRECQELTHREARVSMLLPHMLLGDERISDHADYVAALEIIREEWRTDRIEVIWGRDDTKRESGHPISRVHAPSAAGNPYVYLVVLRTTDV